MTTPTIINFFEAQLPPKQSTTAKMATLFGSPV
jgi:hypothetical protein